MRKITKLFVRNRRWLWRALLIFLIGNLLGFLLVIVLPKPRQLVFQESELYELLKDVSVSERVMILYLHNLQATFLNLFGGILLGFFPIISLLGLGVDLGILFSLSVSYQMVGFFALGILPHGLFELPAVIIAAAWGLKLGLGWIKQPKGKKRVFIYLTLKEGLYVFLMIAILLLMAAIIEGTITPLLLGLPSP